MIRLEDVIARARRLCEEQGLTDDNDLSRDAEQTRVSSTIVALIDEVNAEIERIAGAILERVGARDLTEQDVRAIVDGPTEPEPYGAKL